MLKRLDPVIVRRYVVQIEGDFRRSLSELTPNELWRYGRMNYQSIASHTKGEMDSIMLQHHMADVPRSMIYDQVYKLAIILHLLMEQGKQRDLHSTYRNEIETVLVNIDKLMRNEIKALPFPENSPNI
jgi:hypothetical protein